MWPSIEAVTAAAHITKIARLIPAFISLPGLASLYLAVAGMKIIIIIISFILAP